MESKFFFPHEVRSVKTNFKFHFNGRKSLPMVEQWQEAASISVPRPHTFSLLLDFMIVRWRSE
ncbi:hypothetical protein IC582_022820 [Cucumis melo]